jgi:hypothetical protein
MDHEKMGAVESGMGVQKLHGFTGRPCTSCRQVEFLGEICLHFPGGLKSLDKPPVWVFPKVVVCLDCGLAEFAVPEAELGLIQHDLAKSA